MAIEKSKNKYHWPLPKDAEIRFIVEENYISHIDNFRGAIDLAVSVGVPIYASRSGKVINVKDGSDQYGTDKKFADKANLIQLKHENGEFTEYIHLEKGSARVKVGDKVKAGDHIAEVGLSGWTTTPHLHFSVVREYPKRTFYCVYPQFVDAPKNYNDLIVGDKY